METSGNPLFGTGIKQISRERGISRNSVRKILRSGDTEFAYDRPLAPSIW